MAGGGKLGAGEVDTGDGRLAVKKVGYSRVGAGGNWWESGRCCGMSGGEGNREAESGRKGN